MCDLVHPRRAAFAKRTPQPGIPNVGGATYPVWQSPREKHAICGQAGLSIHPVDLAMMAITGGASAWWLFLIDAAVARISRMQVSTFNVPGDRICTTRSGRVHPYRQHNTQPAPKVRSDNPPFSCTWKWRWRGMRQMAPQPNSRARV